MDKMDLLIKKIITEKYNSIPDIIDMDNKYIVLKKTSTKRKLSKILPLIAASLIICISLTIMFSNQSVLLPSDEVNQSLNGIIADKSLNDLVLESELIVQGTVEELLNSKWTNPDKKYTIRNTLVNDTKIKIDKILKGKPYNNNHIIVRTEGGKTTNSEIISDEASFKKDEHIVLFLKEDDKDIANLSEKYYILTGLAQGKFLLNNKTLKYENNKENFTINELVDLIKKL